MQAGDEDIGLSCPSGLFLDLLVLHGDLATKKFVLPFEARDIARPDGPVEGGSELARKVVVEVRP